MAEQRAFADQLGEFAVDADWASIPAPVRASAADRVLDTLGISLGAIPLPTSAAILDYVERQGGRPSAHALGLHGALPTPLAALANGVLAHSLDYDDTHLPSVIHPSASVVPTALAVGEAVHATGPEVLAAISVGLEIAVRIGMAGYDAENRNSTYFEHGQHATSICGALGSAATAAKLLGGDATRIRDAIAIAASMASGIIEANRGGGTVKRLHCGWAAQSAVTAAELALSGFSGPPTALEGRFGLFEAFLHGRYEPGAVTEGLGSSWSVPDIFYKPYPANHFTHTAVDAASALRLDGIDVEEIEELVLGVPGPVLRTVGEPIDAKRAPRTGYQAQFSGPYAVAVGLLGGGGLGAGLEDYSDALTADPRRRAIMSKVRVVEDAECSAIFPDQFPSVLTARLRDGGVRTVKVLENRGGSRNPLSSAELHVKFIDTAGRQLDAQGVADALERITDIPRVDDIAVPMTALATAAAAAREKRENNA